MTRVSRRVAVVVALTTFAVAGAPSPAAALSKLCRPCKVACNTDALAACVAGDPRLPGCSAKKQAFCLKRANKDCKRNLKSCCLKSCRRTKLVECCGSATSSKPGSGGGGGGGGTVTTTTVSDTTSTTLQSCMSDTDCPTCQCCSPLEYTCGGATSSGGGSCCTPSGGTPGGFNAECGPKQPATCPANAVCAPSGQTAGGTRYDCSYCSPSNLIIEDVVPSDHSPLIGTPSNACTRR